MRRSMTRAAWAMIPLCLALLMLTNAPVEALDGGTLRISTDNGWRAFEVITQGDDPSGDGVSYSMPGTLSRQSTRRFVLDRTGLIATVRVELDVDGTIEGGPTAI